MTKAVIEDFKNAIEFTSAEDLVVFNHENFTKDVSNNTPYRTEYFIIILLTKGELKLLYDFSEYSIEEQSLILFAPRSIYQFNFISNNIELMGMAFNGNSLIKADFFINMGIVADIFNSHIKKFFSLNGEEVNILYSLFNALKIKTANKVLGDTDQKMVVHCFSSILYESSSVFAKYNTLYKAKLNRKEELVLKFSKLLSVHFESERRVTFYAGLLYITPKYLTETVKEVTGKTAGELIDFAVIMQAKILLKNPNLNIGQVSSSLNFSDQSFFGKFFKKHVGVSPNQYRADVLK